MRRWTAEENARFRLLYPTASRAELLAAFSGRTGIAFKQKARKLGLCRPPLPGRKSNVVLVQQLQKERRRRRLTQPKLAERIGIHPSKISHYERGDWLPQMENFLAWVDALDFRLELVPKSRARMAA